jgi:hypothetical protein
VRFGSNTVLFYYSKLPTSVVVPTRVVQQAVIFTIAALNVQEDLFFVAWPEHESSTICGNHSWVSRRKRSTNLTMAAEYPEASSGIFIPRVFMQDFVPFTLLALQTRGDGWPFPQTIVHFVVTGDFQTASSNSEKWLSALAFFQSASLNR